MSVFWEPPQLIQQNGEITGYSLRYRIIGGSYTYADPPDTSYHMESLTPYTTYLISVAAKTAAGTGVYSTEIRQTTAESGKGVYNLIKPYKQLTKDLQIEKTCN